MAKENFLGPGALGGVGAAEEIAGLLGYLNVDCETAVRIRERSRSWCDLDMDSGRLQGMETGKREGAKPASEVPSTPPWHQRIPGLIHTGSLQILFGLRICALLILAGLLFGAAFTDWADDPDSLNAFLDEGWVRSLVDGRGWMLMLAALLVYTVRVGLALRSPRLQRSLQWVIPAELVAVSVLGGLTALGLSWLSVFYLPCVLNARC